MEIKPAWLFEGTLLVLNGETCLTTLPIVAPHYFKAADLEQLATGDKKMPKVVGASSSKS